ncbi:MAG: phosphoglycerate dehydrogenase [Gammaproteobacteria bacterium]|nr:phosphoglycerate dehydrogenase [Gammaproteobacteria bacterium]MDH5240647.1 phosphoglycerate dehydrogenase [Gammaproteobacteria bacterium]MDH5261530.1 phosphoglycerate dehydrogenase [Gammaproteobacteria bacterium]MDH5584151.1 phosphoglycerate dehydrogenase [Gammaproteobacteria bacterium]
MFKILTLNNIAVAGLRRLPRERYEVATEIGHPDAILLRSQNMHDVDIPATVAAIGRAGAGTNNIPVERMSARGIPVFNAPGANANAVKELVIAAMLIGTRNLCRASEYVSGLKETGDALEKAVEAGKKQFVGSELPGKRLGVVGLGAIGVQVANSALALGMKVVGFDPAITVRSAWQLSSGVQHAETLDQLFQNADFVTLHVPLLDATRNLVSAARIALMNDGGTLINFARGGIVDDTAAMAALDSGKLHTYLSDFPTPELIAHPKAVVFPHLGASTAEAEENCAIMVADNVKDYLENGNIRYSVNFPDARMPRADAWRITIANANVPNMVGQISTLIANAGLNIEDLLNKSIGGLAYTIVDVNAEPSRELLDAIRAIDGILTLRNLGKPV